MTLDWQSATAIGFVAVAVGYLVYRARQLFSRKKSGGCASGCGHCERAKTDRDELFVSVDTLSEESSTAK